MSFTCSDEESDEEEELETLETETNRVKKEQKTDARKKEAGRYDFKLLKICKIKRENFLLQCHIEMGYEL